MTGAEPRRIRIDQLLADRGIFASRSRSADAVRRGTVTVGGARITKPGQMVLADADIAVEDPASAYVSRAALKMVHALDTFDLDPAGSEALDVGASTGGFTQVLLKRGAAHVTAIDVGHGQMDVDLAADPRVRKIEGLNARDLTMEHLGDRRPSFLVCDVSFISLKLAIPAALDLAKAGAVCVLLVKPQFEAGREAIGKGGILRDPQLGLKIAGGMRDWLDARSGWRALGIAPSPVTGGDGNREFILAGRKDG